jgi:glucosamine-6-phosphate deaminase
MDKNQLTIGQMTILRHPSREEMGRSVACDVVAQIKELHETKDSVSIVFASAPSQNEFLDFLRKEEGIRWERIVCFHLDEYLGLLGEAPQSFSRYLKDKLFNLRQPKKFHAIDGMNEPDAECERYARLLADNPIDIACIGIGENGHIAFNDPHVADFNDPYPIKIVKLDEMSRRQQVNDGCFASLDEVPKEALTLTIPTILSASHIFCTVPGERKNRAVRETVYGPIDVKCPASVLRKAKHCNLYLDADSASLL